MSAMEDATRRSARIVELADQILRDIRERGLRPGDPYLSTADTARMLHVSTTIANRALQLLEQRRVLVRRQRRGTFIAEPPTDPDPVLLKRVNLVVHRDYLRSEGLLADGVVVGIQHELPGADLQFRFTAPVEIAEAAHQMIADALRSPEPEGFVLVRASLNLQRLVAASGLPAVIHGTPFASVRGVPWIDRDQAEAGRLLTDYLLRRGCERLVLLMRQQVLPGDHVLLDAVRQRMVAEGMGIDRLDLRFLPNDHETIKQEMRWLLMGKKERLGVLCRSEPLAEGVQAATETLGLRVGEDVPIAVSDVYRPDNSTVLGWPSIMSMMEPQEIGRHIGRMLRRRALEPQELFGYQMIPVKLEEPQVASPNESP